jgi:hypothetical protein
MLQFLGKIDVNKYPFDLYKTGAIFVSGLFLNPVTNTTDLLPIVLNLQGGLQT